MDVQTTVREIRLTSFGRRELEGFLAAHGLGLDADTEYALGVYDEEENLVACGCAAGRVLKQFAVAETLRGENILGTVVSGLSAWQYARGNTRLFVYTKPQNAILFAQCGFFPVSQTAEVALLENREHGPEDFAGRFLSPRDAGKRASAIVMNANPFTLGHRYLVEQAARESELLYLFVVEEDRSVFPFDVRLRLVEAGTRDIANVRVLPSGDYIISAASFPAYFIKDKARVQDAYARLDARIFCEHIAPLFGIEKRFVGSEPFCPVTRAYNAILKQECQTHNLVLCELGRRESQGLAISASRVRALLAEHGVDSKKLKSMVPETTLAFLEGAGADRVLAGLKKKDTD